MYQDLAGQLEEYQTIEVLIPFLVNAYSEKHKCQWNEDKQLNISTMILYQVRMTLFDNIQKIKI